MAIQYVTGDLFENKYDADYFAHGCNLQGAMGSGIAVIFRREYPDMYQKYRKMCLAGEFRPGGVFAWYSKDKPKVLNLGTQEYPGPCAKLEYIEKAFNKIVANQDRLRIGKLAMPRIGAGLGGLEWNDVKSLVNSCFAKADFGVIVYEHWQPAP